jgi:hypothetical protein
MAYTGTNITDLSVTTPVEGSTLPSELNDSDREIKTVLKNLYSLQSKTADYTVLDEDSFVICTPTSDMTLNLPAVAGCSSSSFVKVLVVRNYGTANVTLDGNSSETIDGAATLIVRPTQSVILIANGTGWYTIRTQPKFRGAKVYNSADQSIGGSETTLTFDTESYDTDAIHSTSSNTGRLTVPTGVSYVRVTAQVQILNDESTDSPYIHILQDGSTVVARWQPEVTAAGTMVAGTCMQITTGVIPVTAGAYFTVVAEGMDNSTESDYTWFAMEIIE